MIGAIEILKYVMKLREGRAQGMKISIISPLTSYLPFNLPFRKASYVKREPILLNEMAMIRGY